MKKWFAIISLFLVTIGSLYPCCLDDDCASEAVPGRNDDDGGDSRDQGFCSPFSACASCAASAVVEPVYITLREIIPALPMYNAYHAADHEGTYPDLFQPPRCC